MAVEANSLSDCFFTFKCSARKSKVAFIVKQEFVTVRGASCSLLLEKQLMPRIFQHSNIFSSFAVPMNV